MVSKFSYENESNTQLARKGASCIVFVFVWSCQWWHVQCNKFLSISMGISAFALSQCRPFTYILLDIKQQSVNQFAHKHYIGMHIFKMVVKFCTKLSFTVF
jgi:hypothetical protein